ncbi:TetR/AcrR family transcriptional regulator [Kutzneria sp. NPDC051319]|uniref:TetR/AcrR family transcriptional regulator n=1 Tax=Kutzneria sp. NPDC051319 TaxID=3155047 RepID=UPI0034485CA7
MTSQRVRNPWGQGERLRLEILDSAARLLSELGGEQGLTIRGVARATGIAPASIYQHFADKAALVEGLIEFDYQQLSTAMAEADGQCPADAVLDRVKAQMRAYCLFAMAHPGHYRLMLNNRPVTTPPSGPLVDIVKMLIDAFERCERAGVRLRVPARRAAIIVFVGAHGWVALLHASENAAQGPSILDFVDELVWLVTE